MRDSGGPDEQVEIRNESPAAAQVGTRTAEELHDWISKGHRLKLAQKRIDPSEPLGCIGETEGALEELSVGNDADADTLWTQLLEHARRTVATDVSIDQPVCVDQVFHGRLMGRVPSSRQR